jgi:hypothetical protein
LVLRKYSETALMDCWRMKGGFSMVYVDLSGQKVLFLMII